MSELAPLHWKFLGTVEYAEAWALQKDLRQKRIAKEIEDQLLLLEHPSTITLGRLRGEQSLLLPVEQLEQQDVCVVRSDRGGDATLHAPGQLVGYLIVDISAKKLALPDFVERVAGAFLRVLRQYQVDAFYDPDYPGVWIGQRKIVAFGFHIQQGVTMHGFAFNLHTDLSLFNLIIPCGLEQKGVTSLAQEIGEKAPSCEEMAPIIGREIAKALGAFPCPD